jgi:hypothetical protein
MTIQSVMEEMNEESEDHSESYRLDVNPCPFHTPIEANIPFYSIVREELGMGMMVHSSSILGANPAPCYMLLLANTLFELDNVTALKVACYKTVA